MSDYGKLDIERKTGTERIVDQQQDLGFDLLSFWQWSQSDLVSNATRGVVAEYIVARALGIGIKGVRDEWAAYDLVMPSGIKIEVKSAAFIQTWYQKQLSRISFRTPKTLSWDLETNIQSQEKKRHADVYVFALLAHKDKATINPLDISQWEFYVLPTAILNMRKRSQHSIALSTLRKLCPSSVSYWQLCSAVVEAAVTRE